MTNFSRSFLVKVLKDDAKIIEIGQQLAELQACTA